jgi:cytochrome c biogenesis protein CcmG, thiol:disulfide interchange protein DsbE
MHRPFSRFALPLLAAVFLVGAAGSSALGANTKGAKAPEIAITDGINGVTASTKIGDYKGSPVLIVNWLPLCPNCQAFMPEVHRLQKKYGPKGLKVLTITNGKKEYTTKYLSDRGWTFGVGFDWVGTTAQRYGVRGLPGKSLVGADGYLRTWNGTLDQAIEAELPR